MSEVARLATPLVVAASGSGLGVAFFRLRKVQAATICLPPTPARANFWC